MTIHLIAVKQKIDEWEKEMSKYQSHTYPKPSGNFTCVGINLADCIPKGLLWNICTVNKEVLRETYIGPKYGEGQ